MSLPIYFLNYDRNFSETFSLGVSVGWSFLSSLSAGWSAGATASGDETVEVPAAHLTTHGGVIAVGFPTVMIDS